MYHIGKITNTHGIRGEVKIYNLSDFDRFFVGAHMYTVISNEKVHFEIQSLRSHKNLLIVKFKGIDDINEVIRYKGLDLFSDEGVNHQLETDDFHYNQLIDKICYTNVGTMIGKVTRIIEVPQGHIIEIEKTDQNRVLVPFVKAFIESISEDRIVINPIEGLL